MGLFLLRLCGEELVRVQKHHLQKGRIANRLAQPSSRGRPTLPFHAYGRPQYSLVMIEYECGGGQGASVEASPAAALCILNCTKSIVNCVMFDPVVCTLLSAERPDFWSGIISCVVHVAAAQCCGLCPCDGNARVIT